MSGNFEIDYGEIAQSLGAIANRYNRFQIDLTYHKNLG
jgi:hypothetical protein